MQNKLQEMSDLSIKLKNNEEFIGGIELAIKSIVDSIGNGGKMMVCGNGGSATQASHMVGEFIGRFGFDRPALPAISLFDLASTTAIGNDYGYDDVFSRFVSGLGKKDDILFSISTSGNSKNCMKAMEIARENGIINIALLGKDGGKMKDMADIAIIVENDYTPLIQEIHIMVIHDICDKVEQYFFKK